jgi:hypothetical protein
MMNGKECGRVLIQYPQLYSAPTYNELMKCAMFRNACSITVATLECISMGYKSRDTLCNGMPLGTVAR